MTVTSELATTTHVGPGPLGSRVLIAEDEALLALDLEQILLELGCVVVGVCATVEAAVQFSDPFDLAIQTFIWWMARRIPRGRVMGC